MLSGYVLSNLFAKLFLTQLVQSVELLGEKNIVLETTTGQFDTNDNLSVWHHHGHCTEVDLQVLWQFLTTSVTRVLNTGKKATMS